jgi:hypothetical protein
MGRGGAPLPDRGTLVARKPQAHRAAKVEQDARYQQDAWHDRIEEYLAKNGRNGRQGAGVGGGQGRQPLDPGRRNAGRRVRNQE